MSDPVTDGRRVRIPVVVDDCTRECLALVAAPSLSGLRVARELDAPMRLRGRPGTMVSDNPTERTSDAVLGSADRTGVGCCTSRPGKPRLRDELLNETLFRSLPQAGAVRESWRPDDDERPPHSRLGRATPLTHARRLFGHPGGGAALRERYSPPDGLPPLFTEVRSNPNSRSGWMRNDGSRHSVSGAATCRSGPWRG